MSKGDWLVLCALMTEHEHGWRHALHFMMRFFRETKNEVYLISHPSVIQWASDHKWHMCHMMIEDGRMPPYGTKIRREP